MERCPKCGGEVWDNRQENLKRVAKGQKERPEFSCKDKDGCGWIQWPEKAPKETIALGVNMKEQVVKENNDKIKTMVMSYAKDLVVAQIDRTETPLQLTIDYYEELLKAVKHPKTEVIK